MVRSRAGKPRETARSAAGRTALERIAFALALPLLLAVAAELVLQVASLAVSARQVDAAPEAQHRILCVGDSHTFGAPLPVRESYPYQLQARLNEAWPGAYSVVNLGIPGMNTSQVLRRLPANLARFEPEILIVWVGVNNAWNVAEATGGRSGALESIEGALVRWSRLYRLFRVKRHDRLLERTWKERQDSFGLRPMGHRFEVGPDAPGGYAIGFDGRQEGISYDERDEEVIDAATVARIESDYRAIAELARAAGVRPIFITYPVELPGTGFELANEAVRLVTEERDLERLDSVASLERIPRDEWEWAGSAMHPTARLYGEIVSDLIPLIARTR